MSLSDAYRNESKISSYIFQTEDAKEGPKAFAEKRPPKWQGK
jgi:enoyl-CoA hydratase